MKKAFITVQIPRQLKGSLLHVAVRKDLPLSTVIRIALREFLERENKARQDDEKLADAILKAKAEARQAKVS